MKKLSLLAIVMTLSGCSVTPPYVPKPWIGFVTSPAGAMIICDGKELGYSASDAFSSVTRDFDGHNVAAAIWGCEARWMSGAKAHFVTTKVSRRSETTWVASTERPEGYPDFDKDFAFAAQMKQARDRQRSEEWDRLNNSLFSTPIYSPPQNQNIFCNRIGGFTNCRSY